MSFGSLSLRWLSLAVLGPLVLLAALAWWGMRSQLKAEWTDAREEATQLAEASANKMGDELSARVLRVVEYPDPPVPQESSEGDEILAGDDVALLENLRDDDSAGLSASGLPLRVLAALRIEHLVPSENNRERLVTLAMGDEASILTSRALEFADPKTREAWLVAEEALRLSRTLSAEQLEEGCLVAASPWAWWLRRDYESISYLSPAAFGELPGELVPLPSWGQYQLEMIKGTGSSLILLQDDFKGAGVETRSLIEEEVPFGNDLRIRVVANVDLLESKVRRQQGWVFSLLAVSLFIAGFSLFTIHRTVGRERHLANLKSQFVASVSHELRAPLGSIRLMAEALQQEKVSKPAEFHGLIAREGARLSHLIENVLDFARIEEGRKEYCFEECDLTALIRDTLSLMEPLAKENGVTLASEVSEVVASLDPAAIQQALVNLIDNAIQFSPKEGVVTVSAVCKGRKILITVADEGPGIAPCDRQKIFERFHRLGNELRRETQGTGIGLSIVHHIAEAHQGSISVTSTPPQGSLFTLCFPLCVS